jgi:hypothetical protein
MRAARYPAFPSRAASIRNLRSLAFDNLKIFERAEISPATSSSMPFGQASITRRKILILGQAARSRGRGRFRGIEDPISPGTLTGQCSSPRCNSLLLHSHPLLPVTRRILMNEKVFFVRVSKQRHHISFSCDQMGQDSARCTSDSGAFQFRDRVGLRSNLVSDVNFGSKADIPRCNRHVRFNRSPNIGGLSSGWLLLSKNPPAALCVKAPNRRDYLPEGIHKTPKRPSGQKTMFMIFHGPAALQSQTPATC